MSDSGTSVIADVPKMNLPVEMVVSFRVAPLAAVSKSKCSRKDSDLSSVTPR